MGPGLILFCLLYPILFTLFWTLSLIKIENNQFEVILNEETYESHTCHGSLNPMSSPKEELHQGILDCPNGMPLVNARAIPNILSSLTVLHYIGLGDRARIGDFLPPVKKTSSFQLLLVLELYKNHDYSFVLFVLKL